VQLGTAAVALARARVSQGQPFEVAQLHDWPAALVALAVNAGSELTLPTVLTIHDARRDGLLDRADLVAAGLPVEGAGERVSLLEAGVRAADTLTTVSTRYAEGLRSEAEVGSLALAVKSSDSPVVGIENGLDYAVNNPATDPALTSRYSAEDVSNKGRNKTAVIRQLALDLDPVRPLLVAVGTAESGPEFELLLDAAPRILKGDVMLVVAGAAEPNLVARLEALRVRYPDRFAHRADVQDADRRRLFAAADLVVSLVHHEPCDPLPRLAQRYGAVPVAWAGGSTADLVIDCDAALETGTGFTYLESTADALVGAVQRGAAAYCGAGWAKLRRRVMRLDLGWDRPARRHLQVLRQAIMAHA
jgi:starch synthase